MNLDDILGQLPVDQIAAQLGVDPDTARSAVDHALPALVSGMQANAQDEAGAASLATALSQHDNGLADALLGGSTGLDAVDTADGDNIVKHIFGDNRDQVVSQLAGASGVGSGLMSKILPMLAPIVMSMIAKRIFGGGAQQGSGGGGLGDVLGNVLGGGQQSSGGGGLGDVLGSVLGGGQSSGGGLGSILGSVLGGGQQSRSAGGIDIGSILGGLLGGGRR